MKRKFSELVWKELCWQRPFELEAVCEMLIHLAATTPRGPIILESRGRQGKIRTALNLPKRIFRMSRFTPTTSTDTIISPAIT